MPERDGKGQGEDIVQSKRARVGWLALVDYSHKWRELVSSGRLVCRYHDVFLWCYLCFYFASFSFGSFSFDAFVEVAGGPSFNRPSIYVFLSFFFSFCL